ncbi:MAG: sodium:proton antiporter NhaD [Lentisphaeria bacterium]
MLLIALVFVFAYALIALEHPIKINKSAIALMAAGLMWTLYGVFSPDGIHHVGAQLTEKLAETAAIVFFLMAAMTIVEVTDAHGGFEVVTNRIRARSLRSLLWVIGLITFFLSAILDNMTTTIVMVTLMRKLLKDDRQRLLFAGIIVIAANAGGAWSPIGDVTTTMLWIGGQITTLPIVKALLLPALAALAVPLVAASLFLRGPAVPPEATENDDAPATSASEKTLMFCLGMGALLFVPAFKTVTHLPPWLGILFALGVVWAAGEILHRNKSDEEKEHLTLAKALRRIDMPSVIFFIGILLAVAVMSANGQLPALAAWLGQHIQSQALIVMVIGLVSAVVDNIPLVAAAMGMYPLGQYPADSFIWEFLAYCAGTGGSLLIIGSAAGVAAMGLEKIRFFWYVRNVSLLALLGYFAGAAAYILQYRLLH